MIFVFLVIHTNHEFRGLLLPSIPYMYSSVVIEDSCASSCDSLLDTSVSLGDSLLLRWKDHPDSGGNYGGVIWGIDRKTGPFHRVGG
jgi:hypothetical protein